MGLYRIWISDGAQSEEKVLRLMRRFKFFVDFYAR